MTTVAATEFARNFRVYNRQAQREIVEVTNHGKIDGAYISAEDLEILKTAKRSLRRVHNLDNMPDEFWNTVQKNRAELSAADLKASEDYKILFPGDPGYPTKAE